jgi:outer membrane protein
MRTFAIVPALAGLLLAAAPATAAELKLGYVDFQRALNEVEQGKTAKATLQKDFAEKQKVLDRDKTELEKMQAEFEKQATVLSEEAKRDKAVEIQRRMNEAQGRLVGFQKELSEREREATRAIFEKMEALVREIADAEGFTVVVEKNNAGIIVAPPSLDLTNELIRKYNARFKVGDAAAEKKPEKKAEKKKDEKKAAEPKKPAEPAKAPEGK